MTETISGLMSLVNIQSLQTAKSNAGCHVNMSDCLTIDLLAHHTITHSVKMYTVNL